MKTAEVPRGAGGCDFLADPDRRADETAVFWHPDELASVVILTAIFPETASSRITFADLPDDAIRRDAKDGTARGVS